jgi:hypothetical protein
MAAAEQIKSLIKSFGDMLLLCKLRLQRQKKGHVALADELKKLKDRAF